MPGTELFGKEEREQILDVLDNGVLFRYNHDADRNGVWKAKTLEKEFAEFHGSKYCHLTSSGTAADAVSLAAVGIGAEDEVICPPFTFIAPVEAVINCGAVPVFGEIDETLCLTAKGIEDAITPRTKAVMLIHMLGSMAQIDEIVAVCEKHNLILIEDTAQALGGSFKGRMLGTFGKVACYSFDFFKLITAGEGGAVITNDEDVYNTAHMWSDHGHSHIGDNRGAEEHPIMGTNYRISELHAAVGLAQFRKIDTILENQRRNKKVLKDYISKFSKVTLHPLPDEDGDSATFLNIFLPTQEEAEKVAGELAAEGVPSAYWFHNNYHFIKNWTHLKQNKFAGKVAMQSNKNTPDYASLEMPQSTDVVGRLVSIQIKVLYTDEQLKAICNAFDKVLG